MNPPAAVATRAATAGLTDFLDLGIQHCFLKLPKCVFRILEFEPQITMTLGGETEATKLMCALVPRLGSRFDDDPNIHGRPLDPVKPHTLAEDPQVLPTPVSN